MSVYWDEVRKADRPRCSCGHKAGVHGARGFERCSVRGCYCPGWVPVGQVAP